MSVKSTQRITRQDAESRYLNLRLADKKLIGSIRGEAACLSNEELEKELEQMNDKHHGGEGFENYLITE